MKSSYWGRMSEDEDIYSLWYFPSINRFTDEDGNVLHDLSNLFDVWELEEWKKTQEYGLLIDRNGKLCELFYPTELEEYHFLEDLEDDVSSQCFKNF